MKLVKIIIIMTLLSSAVFSQMDTKNSRVTPSYYGFSGLLFIPTAQTLNTGEWGLAYKSKPGAGKYLNLFPFSINFIFSPFMDGLEIGLTNTYIYASHKQFGGVPYREEMDSTNTLIPFIPSVKYRFMPMSESNFQVSMAFGLASPYGAYYVVDKFFNLRFLDITLHAGIGTKLSTYHAFTGATLSFGSRTDSYQRGFPTQLCFEGAWGGSLKQLDEKEEAFYSVSIRHAWTQALFISTFYRVDQQPSIRDGIEVQAKQTKKMGIGLSLIL